MKASIPTFLQHSEHANRCGLFINSPLLTLDPVARRAYQYLEYKPLVNARAHLLGEQPKILNNRLYDQYHQLLTYLSYRPELKNEDLLAVCHYLLLQDRAPEAIAFFERIAPERVASCLQYDYIRAYIGFYTSAFDEMRAIAGRYTDYPVMRWRKRFQQIIAQLDEIDGVQPQTVDRRDRDEMQTHLADETAALDFKIEARQVTIRWQNVQTCQINYYPMDIELLFSKNPFVREHKEHFAYIRPNLTQTIELEPCGSNDSSCAETVELPAQYKNSNLMVEIVAEGVQKTRVYFANSLLIQVINDYGHLKVDHADTHRPLAGVYVKVYARMKGGDARFYTDPILVFPDHWSANFSLLWQFGKTKIRILYKDGYTDWRGRFDYASLSTDDLDQVSRFAILALSDEYGAEILETPPPQQ